MAKPKLPQVIRTRHSLQLGSTESAKAMGACSWDIEAELLKLRAQTAVVGV